MHNFFRSQTLKRFSWVLALSILGIVSSVIFLKPKQSQLILSNVSNQTALLLSSKNEVQRQLQNQLSWEPIEKGILLLKGDKIKTAKNSSAIIQFLKNKTILNIEANSIVVIDQNENNIELKLLSGNLFLKQNAKNEKVQISTPGDGNKLELKNAEAVISVTENGKSSVEMIKGESLNNGENIKQVYNVFSDQRPFYGETLYFTKENIRDIEISWLPLDERYDIEIYTGKSREELLSTTFSKSDIKHGKLYLKKNFGTFFWQLRAVDKKTNEVLKSSTLKLNIDPLLQPTLAYPINNQTIRFIESEGSNLEFKWALPTPLQEIQIQISKNETFDQLIIDEAVTKQTYFETNSIVDESKYFWKIKGKIPGTNDFLSSNVNSFNLIKGKIILAPELLSPANNFIEYIEQDLEQQQNIILSWKAESNASSYVVTLKHGNIKKEFTTSTTSHIFSGKRNNTYSWFIQSIDEYGKKSNPSEVRNFKFSTLNKINILESPKGEITFINKLPSVDLKWELVKNAQRYILYTSQSAQFTNKEKLETKNTQIQFEVLGKGQNYFYIEGIDENLQTIARSKTFQSFIKEKDLPSPPTFLKDKNLQLTSDLEGKIEIVFNNTSRNEKIQTELRDSKNNIIEKSTIESSNVTFSDLKPGLYYVQAKLIDEDGRISDYSEKRTIVVPEKSSIKTPKIKNIRIK